MTKGAVVSRLRVCREAAGVSQESLARAVGVSRQSLGAVEAGRTVPSTALALRLARALGRSVEQLFALPAAEELEVTLVAAGEAPSAGAASQRVALGRVGGRWIAHPIAHDAYGAADALLTRSATEDGAVAVEPLLAPSQLEHNVLIAGCAPLLETLARRAVLSFRDARATWLPANSTRALELLATGRVHVAGLHGSDAGNVEAIRKRFRGRPVRLVNLTRWRQGLVVAPGNPRGLREVSDVLQRDLRLARREPGAGADHLLRRLLAAEIPTSGPLARGHVEVATLVRVGAADVGVAIEGAALSAGLGFVPLAEERFDLVVPAELVAHPPVARLLELLGERGFRSDAAALPGYDGALCGDVTELDAA